MRAHKIRVMVSESHEVSVRLPSDFPSGTAELIVIADGAAVEKPQGIEAAREFKQWLDALLRDVPPVTALPPEAFERSAIYDD